MEYMLMICILVVIGVVSILIGRKIINYINRIEYVITDNNGHEIVLTKRQLKKLIKKAKGGK
jgi:xanthosine utilization system XapX-like protein